VEDSPVNFKLDPGAHKSILPFETYKSLKTKEKMKRVNVKIKPYGKNSPAIDVLGSVELTCSAGGITKKVPFLVIVETNTPLFSLKDCENFGLITRHIVSCDSVSSETDSNKGALSKFINENEDLFKGLGHFPGKHRILTKPDAEQVIRPALRKPTYVNEKLKLGLDKLENRNVIEKVEQLTPDCWVSNLVTVTKPDGDIRICIDPHDLNQAIIREPHLIPSLPELTEKINCQKFYTLLDLKDGFYHIELDESSKNKCCFATPFGIYRFLRLPFGVSSAPELFQKINEKVFGDIPGVTVYFDDVLVAGKTEEQHDKAVKQVLERARNNNVRFNPKKVQYKQLKVRYIGHVFSEAGMELDPDRVQELLLLKTPTNRDELQSVMGMFGYVRQFVPKMSELTRILNDLRKKDVVWNWTEAHTAAYNKVKMLISKAPVLANFDPKKPIVIQADASKDGLGCCLLQDGHLVSCGSRALSPSEHNYSVSEKEMLAICFATHKFHNFIFGYRVLVQTDHQPLVPMFKKEIHKIGSRTLQRLRLKLLNYDIDVNYLPGKFMFVADMLSRLFNNNPVDDDPTMFETVHSLSSCLPVNDSLKCDLVNATAEDGTLQQLVKFIQVGWPKNRTQVPDPIIPYYKVRNELFCEDGLVLFNDENSVRIVVPTVLRPKMLKIVHAGHMGVDKCKYRAKQAFYWPSMSDHVILFVKMCPVCEKFRSAPPKHVLNPHELPSLMWERLSIDIATYGGDDFLIVYDSYSKWLEIVKLSSKSAASVINVLKTIFSTHGDPKVIVCDNNPFNSHEFRQFAKGKFQIVTSSPNFPSSNGRAEKGVAISKDILRKAKEDRSDFRDLLKEYRNTVVPSMQASPAQLLFSRRLRTDLPVSDRDLRPRVQSSVVNKLQAQRQRTANWYNRSARRGELKLEPGDPVLINSGKKGETWVRGVVRSKLPQPRSFVVSTPSGSLRRTTKHIRVACSYPSVNDCCYEYDFRPTANNNPEIVNPDIVNPDIVNPDIVNPGIVNPEIVNPDPELANPELVNPETVNSTPTSQETPEEVEEQSEFQLIVPHWLYQTNYVTRSGRVVKPPMPRS
jgi:hypothetical protein